MVMTYGWIFIVGIGAVIIISQTGVFNQAPVDKTKYGFSQVVPVDWGVYMDSNRIVSRIENWAGDKVNVTDMIVSLDEVLCESSDSVIIGPGESRTVVMQCSSSPSLSDRYVKGSGYIADVTIKYMDITSGEMYSSKGTVRGPVEEGGVTTTTLIPLPDLAIRDIYEGPGGEIRYIINNPSDYLDAPASSSNVTIWDSTGGLVSSSLQPAAPVPRFDGSNDEDSGFNIASCPEPGKYFTVGVYADWPKEITETDETNNYLTRQFYCLEADLPPVVELISPCDCCDESGNFVGCP